MPRTALNNTPKWQDTLSEPDTFTTTIDLPGETVEFWRSTKTIKVVLRRHRDVIFDIKLFKGMIYSVHSEESEFYDARLKKIFPRGKVHY